MSATATATNSARSNMSRYPMLRLPRRLLHEAAHFVTTYGTAAAFLLLGDGCLEDIGVVVVGPCGRCGVAP